MSDVIEKKARAARDASYVLSSLSTEIKNKVLLELADRLAANRDAIFAANAKDMEASRQAGLAQAKLKRLEITESVLQQMVEGLKVIAALPDPLGGVVKDYRTDSGLQVQKVRVSLGVIAMIYEARANVYDRRVQFVLQSW